MKTLAKAARSWARTNTASPSSTNTKNNNNNAAARLYPQPPMTRWARGLLTSYEHYLQRLN